MKKKILSIAIVATVAVAAAWSFNQSNQELALTDVALSNVEALAQSESSEEFKEKTGCEAVWENTTCYGKDGNYHSYARRI